MALSRIMPYGASELLETQDERMAKATLAAMGLIALAIAAAGTVAALLPHERVVGSPQIDEHYFVATPNYTPPAPAVVPHITPHTSPSPHAIPVPTPDTQVLHEPAPVVQGSGTDLGHGVAALPGSQVAPGTNEDSEAPPLPGEFVVVDEYPVLIKSAAISYPDMARDAGVEGRVVVLMLVGKDGHVLATHVDPKHSVPMLDAAAIDCARSCVFKPALTNNHPVMVWVSRPFEFRLH